jgi:hypothetical protein
LAETKRLLRGIMPRHSSSVLYTQHVAERGRELFAEVCARDVEVVVVKRGTVLDASAVIPKHSTVYRTGSTP